MAEKIQAYYFIGTMSGVYTKVYDGKKMQADATTYYGYLNDDSYQTQITDGNMTHVNEYGTMVYDDTLGKNKGTLDLHYDNGYPKVSREGVDVTNLYNQTQVTDFDFSTKTPGCMTFTIISRDVTLKSATISKEYDGTVLTAYSNPPGGGTVVTDLTEGQTDKGYASGEEFNYTFTGSQLFVGSTDNEFSVSDKTALTSDYNVTKQYGQLIVTKRTVPVTITVKDQERLYDGTADIKTGDTWYTVEGDLATGDTITVTLINKNGSINAGTYTDGITATYKITHSDGTDVTDMYANVTVIAGDLIIDKRNVTITSGSATKPYDGTPLTKNSAKITGGEGFVGGEGYTANVTGSQTEVGTSKNYFTVSAAEGTNLNNYNITKIEGDLTVTPAAAITITADSGSKMYDGSALTKGTYSYTGTLNSGDYLSVTVTGSITDFGTAANKVSSYKIYNAAGKDVTSSYAQAELIDGTLSITKRDVVLTSDSASKKYDGTPLTNDTIIVTGSGFVAGQGATYDVTGSQTAVGSSANTFTYVLNSNTKADNYSISTELGTLTVTPNDTLITITANSKSKMYDGTALSDSGYTYTGKLATGDYFASVTVVGEQTHFGEAANVVTGYVIKNQAGDNVTSFYTNIQTANGTLSITKRDVTLTSESDSKKYDGTPLTNDTITVSGSGFVSGEGATYNVTGSQTAVGSSKNTFSYDLNQGTYTADYAITTKEGTLTVYNADAITITAKSNSKMYDGTALTDDGYTVSGTLGAGDHVEDVVINSSITDAGTAANKISSYKIYNAAGEDVTSSYAQANLIDGTLTVTARNVTITSGSGEKVYDGTPLTNDYTYVSGDGFVGSENYTATVTGSQTLPGTSKNTFTYDLVNGAKAQNYNVTTVEGDLTVTKGTLTITIGLDATTGLSYLYDGTATKALVEGEYQVTGLLGGDKVTNVSITTESSNVGIYNDDQAMTYTVKYDLVDAAGQDASGHYDTITLNKNDVTITPRYITIQAGSDSKVYDGTALTCNEWTLAEGGDGLAPYEKIDGVKMTEDSTITHVGSTANKVDPSGVTISKADGSDSSMNYVVDTLDGTLTVTKRSVLLISTSAEKYYDGTALQNRQVIVTGLSYLEGQPVQGEGFLPGDGCTYDFVNDNIVIDAEGNIISWTVSEQSDTAYGQTDVGTSKNEFNYHNFTSVYAGSYESDYEIIYGNNTPEWFVDKYGQKVADGLFGDLTVWGGPVEIDMTDYSWTYDYQSKSNGYFDDGYTVVFTTNEEGTEQTITQFAHNSEGSAVALFGDDTIVVTVTGQGGSVETGKVQHVSDGEKQNKATYTIYRKGVDVTAEVADYYQISIDGGVLNITPRNVQLVSTSASKRYDGTAIADNTITEGSEGRLEGFIYGEGAAYEVTGSQTEIGTSDNTFAISELLTDTQATDYNFQKTYGKLTVTGGPVSDYNYTNKSDIIQFYQNKVYVTYDNGDGKYVQSAAINDVTGWEVVEMRRDLTGDSLCDVQIIADDKVGSTWVATLRNDFLKDGALTLNYQFIGAYDNELWRYLGSADVNGDGKAEVLMEQTKDGADGAYRHVAAWVTDSEGKWVDNEWVGSIHNGAFDIAGTADLDGNGTDNVILRRADGTMAYWSEMGTNEVIEIADANKSTMLTSADFSGDGADDILFTNTKGDFFTWSDIATGVVAEKIGNLDDLGGNWAFAGAGDYNGDGKEEILWCDGVQTAYSDATKENFKNLTVIA